MKICVIKVISIVAIYFYLIISIGFAQNKEVSSSEMFKAFNQTTNGNCVAVAYIKASIFTFGLDSVFYILPETPESWVVRLQNDDSITLIETDLQEAAKSAAFVYDQTNIRYNDISVYALLCYAVMAKERQKIDKLPSYESALDALGKGANSRIAWNYLGLLPNQIEVRKNSSVVNGLGGMVIWRWHHAVFACYGYMNLERGQKKINLLRRLLYYGRVRLKRV